MEDIRYEALASNDNVIVGRLLPGTDLVNGIKEVCKANNIKYGTLICCLGSLARAEIIYAIPDTSGKIGIKYSDKTTIEGPLELISCQGMIGQTAEYELSFHIHGVFSDRFMNVWAGHVVEGCRTLATVEFTILRFDEGKLTRAYNDETGFNLFNFNK